MLIICLDKSIKESLTILYIYILGQDNTRLK